METSNYLFSVLISFISFSLSNQVNNAQEYGTKDSEIENVPNLISLDSNKSCYLNNNEELIRDESRQKALDHSCSSSLCKGQISKSMNSMSLKKMDNSIWTSVTDW